jgi:hypothetical protein
LSAPDGHTSLQPARRAAFAVIQECTSMAENAGNRPYPATMQEDTFTRGLRAFGQASSTNF